MRVLPAGFHRIRHYGLFANDKRDDNIARARALLAVASQNQRRNNQVDDDAHRYPHRGLASGRLNVRRHNRQLMRKIVLLIELAAALPYS